MTLCYFFALNGDERNSLVVSGFLEKAIDPSRRHAPTFRPKNYPLIFDTDSPTEVDQDNDTQVDRQNGQS